MILLLLIKWRIIDKYNYYRPAKFGDFCEMCAFGWIAIIEYIYYNIYNLFSAYAIFNIFTHALACWFISLIVRKLYLML